MQRGWSCQSALSIVGGRFCEMPVGGQCDVVIDRPVVVIMHC